MRLLSKSEIKKLVRKQFKRDIEIHIILENIEYTRNVASIFRTADASGVRRVYLTGISKTPPFGREMKQVSRNKEDSVEWKFDKSSRDVIKTCKNNGFYVIACELTDKAFSISELPFRIKNYKKVCFVFGSEVYGVNKKTLEVCDASCFIPMYGKGASLNVGSSVAITLFSF